MDTTLVDADLRALAFAEDEYLGEGEVLHLSEGRAVLRFPLGCFQQLGLGADVQLTFRTGDGLNIHLPARLSGWRAAASSETSQFELRSDPNVVESILSQRGEVRVFPDPTQPVAVKLRLSEDSSTVSVLRDLSPGGVGAIVPHDAELIMPRSDEIGVTFTLPGDLDAFAFNGRIHHCKLWSNAVLVGIGFTTAVSGEMAEERARIRNWCETRHQQIQERLRTAHAA